jgi:hypothetical protein
VKALAEFVMRGRLHALLVVLVGVVSVVFCWVSAAALALVTLRKGAADGAWLLMWALLPAGALLLYATDSGPLALLVGTTALALVLRVTMSLALTVLASAAVGLVTALGVWLFAGAMLEQLVQLVGDFLATMERQLAVEGAGPVTLVRPTAVQVAGMLGAVNALMSVMGLLLGRYWQGLLYNPGGFGTEFRALALPGAVATGLAVAGLGLAAMGLEYRTWGMIFLVPLTFAGLALVHARARWRGQGTGFLTGFYLLWVFFDLVKLVLVVIAVVDSWQHFRLRWTKADIGGDQGGQE